jgi:hypothetical protein
VEPGAGAKILLSGGYDFEPAWLRDRDEVIGRFCKSIPGQNRDAAWVVELHEPITAVGDVRGKRQEKTGRYLVLELRYVGQVWENEGTVHVELCESEPAAALWPDREIGAWVESHATYRLYA